MNIPKIIRPFGGVTGITMQPTGLNIGLGGSNSNIKSFQRGNHSIGTVTINAVDPSKTLVRSPSWGGQIDSTGGGNSGCPYITLASATALTLGSAYNVASIDWEAIEFQNIKSLQSGTLSAISGTVTVSAVNPSNASLFCSARATMAVSSYLIITTAKIVDSTTLSFTLQGNGSVTSSIIYWTLVEWS